MAISFLIVAATVSRFEEDSDWGSQEWFETILRFPGINRIEQIEQTYPPCTDANTKGNKNLT